MNETNDYAFKTYIKDIYIELPDYEFLHKPLEEEEIFIGRNDNISKFSNILSNSADPTGAYMVTGFRGMGKTSFVNRVIAKYKERKEKDNIQVHQVKVNLGNTDLGYASIIRQIIFSFKSTVLSDFQKKLLKLEQKERGFKIMLLLWVLMFFTYFFGFSINYSNDANGLKSFIIKISQFISNVNYAKTGNAATFSSTVQLLGNMLIVAIVFSVAFIGFVKFINKFVININLYKELDDLFQRANVEETKESNTQNIFANIPVPFLTKYTQKQKPLAVKDLETELSEIIKKYYYTSAKIPRKKSKRIADKIGHILKNILIKRFFARVLPHLMLQQRMKEFVFVFDELDKLDTGYFNDDLSQATNTRRKYENIKASVDDMRDKKQMMLLILACLKYLITESRARYIFICGREMYESFLADIADRQSSIGSIFNYVFYVDSFLSEQLFSNAKLSQMTEEYFSKILLPNDKFLKKRGATEAEIKRYNEIRVSKSFLFTYKHLLDNRIGFKKNITGINCNLSEDEIFKIIVTLEQLITYLTYRSNGSPKKLCRLIENLIIRSELVGKIPLSQYKTSRFSEEVFFYKHKKTEVNYAEIITASCFKRYTIKLLDFFYSFSTYPKIHQDNKSNVSFLHLSYSMQYKIGIINYLYKPYLVTYGSLMSGISDYLLVSTSYLVDHILKFHPFAFSKRNLDLLPEIIAINSSPQLRILIDELLQFLSVNYIRNTETPLYEYKFYTIVSNEIAFLSKIYEEESAAFNFTLDESYSIKQHIKNKILELRDIYKGVNNKSSYDFIHSIAALNNLLGDARFFDQEYDDAITSYSDALQALRGVDAKYESKIEIALIIIELQLKLGLTYEKMNVNEYALAYYSDAVKVITNVLKKNCTPNYRYISSTESVIDEDNSLPKSAIIDLFEIGCHAFVAVLYIQEKIGFEGVSLRNIFNITVKLNQLFDQLDQATIVKSNGNRAQIKSLQTLKALINSNIGILCFYKNLPFDKAVYDLFRKDGSNENFDIFNCFSFVDKLSDKLKNENINKRYSSMSLIYNLRALDHLLTKASSNDFDMPKYEYSQGKTWENFALYKIYCTTQLLTNQNFVKTFDKHYLEVFASTLSRLGDDLLTVLYEVNPVTNKIENYNELSADIFEVLHLIINFGRITTETSDPLKISKILSNRIGIIAKKDNNLFNIIALYYLSSKFFNKSQKYKSAGFQYKKIIHIINKFTSLIPNDHTVIEGNISLIKKFLNDFIVREALNISSNSSNGTDRDQVLNLKEIFNVDQINTPENKSANIYTGISTNPDLKEILYLYAEFNVRVQKLDYVGCDKLDLKNIFREQSLLNPNNLYTSQWSRIMGLNLQSIIDAKIIDDYIFQKLSKIVGFIKNDKAQNLSDNWSNDLLEKYGNISRERLIEVVKLFTEKSEEKTNDENEGKIIEFVKGFYKKENLSSLKVLVSKFNQLLASSIHSLTHAINITHSFDSVYPIGNAFLGDLYYRLGKCSENYQLCFLLNIIVNEQDKVNQNLFPIEKLVNNLISPDNVLKLVPTAQFQLARTYYYKVLSMHQSSDVFNHFFREKNYLEDDFTDNLHHFSVASERLQVNSGEIQNLIKKCEIKLKHSTLFEYERYL